MQTRRMLEPPVLATTMDFAVAGYVALGVLGLCKWAYDKSRRVVSGLNP